MTTNEIPEKAIEAVMARLAEKTDLSRPSLNSYVREIVVADLESAAPFLKAQALREVAEEFGHDTWELVWAAADVDDDVSAVQATTAWLRTCADDMEANA